MSSKSDAQIVGKATESDEEIGEEMNTLFDKGSALDTMKMEPKTSSPPPTEPPRSAIIFGVALYAFCSSTLLVINKVAMHLVPHSSLILFCQFLSSAAAVRGLFAMRPDMDIELLKWDKAKPFALATLVFYLCLFSNTQALKSVNVETVIVVRSCSPIAVAFLERATLGRPLPSLLGLMALLMIAAGAALYVVTDQGFKVEGYTWLSVYFVSIVSEMVFVKFVVDTVPMSTWTRVYYNNVMSLPMAIISAFAMGDSSSIAEIEWTAGKICAVLLSCVVGVAISYAGFNLRKLVSATSFTVVGVVCKLITVLINDVIW
eukprot:CAMPEP_0176094710 /NCGR_PEP_ID=MMETSP0120_2-20121206/47461_1 /TAXON_ID=160619 /ORGANISM="Kryptoperidinium foliaceum, Strain CCMP 1326" /LENGTH=316 /DNA_ID=CAMNT_0017428655 /DNA_START=51 /DNA_END=998 /DNA_ORIENTATION=+